VAVVGCTGSVGVPASRLLAGDGYDLVLVGRTEERVRNRLPELAGRARVAAGLDSVAESDVVVLLTADASARLQPRHVSSGAVVIDVAQPGNVDPALYGDFRQRGAVVVEGALVRIPGYRCTVDMGMPGPEDTAACVAESYLFAREGIREHSVGYPSPELAERLERVALRRGIHPRPLDLLQAASLPR
jgi:predicted amino acid dehydrogenase